MAKTKTLPHNTEIEQAVLGAMLRSNVSLNEALAGLLETDFYEENQNHRVIFRAMLSLSNQSIAVDPQTVINELIVNKTIDLAGGPEYLFELSDSFITNKNIPEYISNIRDLSILRDFIKKCDELSVKGSSTGMKTVRDYLRLSQKEIDDIVSRRPVEGFKSSQELSKILSKKLQELQPATTADAVTGTNTGFRTLNILTHGFQPGELIILAARPGKGKTALSLNLSYNAALHGKRVAYFSLEMSSEELFKRLISAESNVDFENLRTGFGLNAHSKLKLVEACQNLSTLHVHIDESNNNSIVDIQAKCRKLAGEFNDLGLIVVDYIGLVSVPSSAAKSDRQAQVQLVSQSLKKLALELKVPVLVACQLNRMAESNISGEPTLSNLRESGSLEQDADIVMLLSEPKNSSQNKEGEKKNVISQQNQKVADMQNQIAQKEDGKDTKLIKVNVAKNRSGKTGNCYLFFRSNVQKFVEPSKESEDEIASLEEERINYFDRGQ